MIGIVELLSGDPHAKRNEFTAAAEKRFAKWKDHAAVTHLARMRAKGFAWDIPAQYAVYLSTPPDVREGITAPNFFALQAGGAAELGAWRAELADFVRASGFEEWDRRRAPRREKELAAVRAAAAGRDLAPPLVKYLGLKPWDSWKVIVDPFAESGGGASWVLEEKPGLPDVIVVSGLYSRKKGFWGGTEMSGGSPEEFAQSVWPEAVFAMTYAMYEVCRPKLNLVANACEGLTGLSNAEDCVQQTWVRGVVARLIESEYGAAAARNYREHWPPTPFQAKVDAVLRAYEADRKAQPDLMSAAGALLAPFQRDGRAPACTLVEKSRFPETVYSRRLAYYQLARERAGGSK